MTGRRKSNPEKSYEQTQRNQWLSTRNYRNLIEKGKPQVTILKIAKME